jgi:UDP-N-acetylmuramoyl-L-alanyl-D-glutamate--2,6-diaminopimelate ligase
MARLSSVLGEGPDLAVSGFTVDSRHVGPGEVFVALPGHHMHGARFATAAVEAGAIAVITDETGREACAQLSVPVVVVANPRARLGGWCRALYATGDLDLRLVGVTGTNGKTSVTHMVEAGCLHAGLGAGIIGTLGVRFPGVDESGERTTPEAPQMHRMLRDMAQHGVDVAVVEVSSHALAEHRVDGLMFDIAAFTNLSRDHLDYHGSMEDYFAAKASLFTRERSRLGLVGIDDEWGQRLAAQCSIPIQTWSCVDSKADWFGQATEEGLVIRDPAGARFTVHLHRIGPLQAANATCAAAILRSLGVGDIGNALIGLQIPGRMEEFSSADGVHVIVDYAHTPVAIEQVIASVERTGRVIVVLGAGGDRDREKRPAMGLAAAAADMVIVTDDNPRSEDPAAIRASVLAGVQGAAGVVEVIADRRVAIERAVAHAQPGDTVLVLGKGHEQGQECAGVVHPFDDREVVRIALERRVES